MDYTPQLFNQSVPAGFTSTFSDAAGTPLDLNELCIKHPASTFFVKVDGFSMVNAGIFDGDMLVVDRSLTSENNDIVIAMLNGGFTVKRLLRKNNKVALVPENEKYSIRYIQDEDSFEIWGVVTYVIKKV